MVHRIVSAPCPRTVAGTPQYQLQRQTVLQNVQETVYETATSPGACGPSARRSCSRRTVTTVKNVVEQQVRDEPYTVQRPVYRTVPREVQYTVQRPVVRTVWKDVTLHGLLGPCARRTSRPGRTRSRTPVRETSFKTCTYNVSQPVREVCYKDVCYTVCRPVQETVIKTVSYTVCRPVQETCYKTCVYTVCRPVQ